MASEARILSGRCLPYGEGLDVLAIAEAIREAAGIGEDEARDEATERLRSIAPSRDAAAIVARLATLMGLSAEPFSSEEMTWAIRRFLEHLARARPLVLVIDDVQWADLTLVRSVESLADLVRDASILVILVGRPELEEALDLPSRSGWPAADRSSSRCPTKPSARSSHSSFPGRPRRQPWSNGFVGPQRGIRSSSSNSSPRGRTAGTRITLMGPPDLGRTDGWPVPATLEALLRSRLDGLPATSRGVVERGAVSAKSSHRERWLLSGTARWSSDRFRARRARTRTLRPPGCLAFLGGRDLGVRPPHGSRHGVRGHPEARPCGAP